MARLFGRAQAITVNTIKLSPFTDVAFTIEKTLRPEPNTCELKIWNLNEDQRSALQAINPKRFLATGQLQLIPKPVARGIPVRIEAGYDDPLDPNRENLSLLWLGDLRWVTSVREGPDWVTTLEAGDGEKAFQNARVNISYGPKTPLETVLRALVRTLGVGEGNVEALAAKVRFNDNAKLFPHGTVLNGSVAKELTDFCRSADLEWYIEDGKFCILNRGKALSTKAIKVSEETGMLGSPTVDNDGILSVTIQMTPDIRPGLLIDMDAEQIKGGFRIEKARWSGDTAGESWSIELQAKKY